MEPLRVGGALSAVRVVQVAMGDNYTAAVTAGGKLLTFGCGLYGRLGHGGRADELAPREVLGALEGEIVAGVAAGDEHTVALTTGGGLFTFGYGEYGRLGHGDETFWHRGGCPGCWATTSCLPALVTGSLWR
jgi:alpha-tubulin suppressor-like RCC1 family protein